MQIRRFQINYYLEMVNKNVLLLGHDGEDFYKARIPFAKYLRNEGYNVSIMLPLDKFTDLIALDGFTVAHSRLERDNTNPLALIKAILSVRSYAAKNDIHLVHSFKFVPNLINSFSNIFTRRKVVLHIAGLGIAFANTAVKYKFLKFVQQVLFLIQFLRANLVIIQNPDDYNDFLFKQYFRKKIKVVEGSGVDIDKFSPAAVPKLTSQKIVFLCTTRLIWEKGIQELVNAFRSLPPETKRYLELRIIGEPDDKNPRGITQTYIDQYKADPVTRFLGRQGNIQEHLRNSDIFILPSYYREGIPRSILEALSTGLPIVTTNVPGCNLTVLPGVNGLLIPPRSSEAIKSAVLEIIGLRNQWNNMGKASRDLAISRFSEGTVFNEIAKLYKLI